MPEQPGATKRYGNGNRDAAITAAGPYCRIRLGMWCKSTWATMTVQMPEETYQRMKEYLKLHRVKQMDFLTRLMESAREKEDPSTVEGNNG